MWSLRRLSTSATRVAAPQVREQLSARGPSAKITYIKRSVATKKTLPSRTAASAASKTDSKQPATSAATTETAPSSDASVFPAPSLTPRSYIAPIRDSSYSSPENTPQTVQKMTDSVGQIEQAENLNEDWSTSFGGLGSRPFEPRIIEILMAPVEPLDVEITPDGLLYLPEIKYRRILNRAFGPGGWGIAPRTKTMVTAKQVTREYGLVCLGRLVSVSRGEQDYFNADGVTTAMEGCKSNALMRCCKDLGIASELWDPSFIRVFKSKYCDSKYFEKKRRYVWKRKDRVWEYPYNQ